MWCKREQNTNRADNDCRWVRLHKCLLDSSTTEYWNHVMAVEMLWLGQRHEDVVLLTDALDLCGFTILVNTRLRHQAYEVRHLLVLIVFINQCLT